MTSFYKTEEKVKYIKNLLFTGDIDLFHQTMKSYKETLSPKEYKSVIRLIFTSPFILSFQLSFYENGFNNKTKIKSETKKRILALLPYQNLSEQVGFLLLHGKEIIDKDILKLLKKSNNKKDVYLLLPMLFYEQKFSELEMCMEKYHIHETDLVNKCYMFYQKSSSSGSWLVDFTEDVPLFFTFILNLHEDNKEYFFYNKKRLNFDLNTNDVFSLIQKTFVFELNEDVIKKQEEYSCTQIEHKMLTSIVQLESKEIHSQQKKKI